MPGAAEYSFSNRARERFFESFPGVKPEHSLEMSVDLTPQQCKDFGLEVRAGWYYRYDNENDIVLACGEGGERGDPVVITALRPKRAWKPRESKYSRGGLNGSKSSADFEALFSNPIPEEPIVPPVRELPKLVPPPVSEVDDDDRELAAMQSISRAMKELGDAARARVVRYFMERYAEKETS